MHIVVNSQPRKETCDMDQKKKTTSNKSTNSTSKNNTGNNQVDSRMKDFIRSSVNPDNNAFFEERSNPLCSKGDWLKEVTVYQN